MTHVFVDIETTPTVEQSVRDEIASEIKAPGNLKKPESIDAWVREEKPGVVHDAILKTSFSGMYGHVCCIGVALDDDEPQAFYVDSKEPHKHEAKVLTDFFAFLNSSYRPNSQTRPVFIGHNLSAFDLRFIFQRAVVLGIKPPAFIPFDSKPWEPTIRDTMLMWAGFKGSVKLDKLAKALGLPGKQGMSGADVWPAVAAGNIARVAEYCLDDVRMTRDVYRRMTFQTLPAAA